MALLIHDKGFFVVSFLEEKKIHAIFSHKLAFLFLIFAIMVASLNVNAPPRGRYVGHPR